MTRRDVQAAMYAQVSEKIFRQQVLTAARLHSWTVYFTWSSLNSPAGFPDLVLVRNGYLIFAELKSEDGKMTPEQLEWKRELEVVQNMYNASVRYFEWRPHDIDEILRVLAP